MAQRSFSVVVLPDDWDGSIEELAQKMMPVTRRGPNQVLPLLARGPMTLEADLSVEEAGLLQARLNKLGVPARVVDEAGDVVADSAHGSASQQKTEAKPASKPKLKLPKPKASDSTSEAASGGEWASVLPGFDAPDEPRRKSLDELAGDSDAYGAEPAPPKREQEQKTPPPQPPSPGLQVPEPQAPSPKSFDTSKMSDALHSASGDRPPYAPEGFDDSMSHIPLIAALLSVIAPGAGQVYNGQDEMAREYGVRFALVVPWYNSVGQAHEYAEKIRTYWAPRPEPGALVAALKYLAIWWLVAGSAFAALGWTGLKLYDVAKTPEAPKITEADVESALGEAREEVQMARIAALDGVAAYLDERDRNHKRFTMSKDERAERLFRRGLVYCKNKNFATCASAMKRVSNLSPRLRRDAYRLQAWASVQLSSQRDREPMPEVSTLESLGEFEQRQLQKQKDQEGKQQEIEETKNVDAGQGARGASTDEQDTSETPP